MTKLMIDVRPDGTALVDGVLWGVETVKAAVAGAAVCRTSRRAREGCECTCCQMAEAFYGFIPSTPPSAEECMATLKRVDPQLYAEVMTLVGKTRAIHSTVENLQGAMGQGKKGG